MKISWTVFWNVQREFKSRVGWKEKIFLNALLRRISLCVTMEHVVWLFQYILNRRSYDTVAIFIEIFICSFVFINYWKTVSVYFNTCAVSVRSLEYTVRVRRSVNCCFDLILEQKPVNFLIFSLLFFSTFFYLYIICALQILIFNINSKCFSHFVWFSVILLSSLESRREKMILRRLCVSATFWKHCPIKECGISLNK